MEIPDKMGISFGLDFALTNVVKNRYNQDWKKSFFWEEQFTMHSSISSTCIKKHLLSASYQGFELKDWGIQAIYNLLT